MKRILMILTAASVIGTASVAGAATVYRWTKYVPKNTTNAPVLFVKTRCLRGEDSMSHPKILKFSDERIVIGCKRHGY